MENGGQLRPLFSFDLQSRLLNPQTPVFHPLSSILNARSSIPRLVTLVTEDDGHC